MKAFKILIPFLFSLQVNSFVIDRDSEVDKVQNMTVDNVNISTILIDESDDSYSWIAYKASLGYDNLPQDAVKSGVDINGHTLYVIRAFDNETQSMKVGKFAAVKNYASILNDDREVQISTFEILQSKNFKWSSDVSSDRSSAVIAGQDENGNVIFVCRALLQVYFLHEGYKTSWTPGELRPNNICAISYAGSSEIFQYFEILKIVDEGKRQPDIDYIEGEFVYDTGARNVNYNISMYKDDDDVMRSTTTENAAVQNYEWISWNEKDIDIPRNTVIGGEDVDGSPLYIAKIGKDSASLYGKFAIKRQNAYVSNARAEFGVIIFDLLVSKSYSWCDFNPNYNYKAVPICRAKIENSIVPGKLLNNGKCRIGFAWDVYEFKEGNFDVLQLDDEC